VRQKSFAPLAGCGTGPKMNAASAGDLFSRYSPCRYRRVAAQMPVGMERVKVAVDAKQF
jgi:hypothetical protein